jgi:hypothetical protein
MYQWQVPVPIDEAKQIIQRLYFTRWLYVNGRLTDGV